MATVLESMTAPLELGAGLQQAADTISYRQELTFTLYNECILPLDGFRFWVNAAISQNTPSAVYNGGGLNSSAFNSMGPIIQTPSQEIVYQFSVLGSLHYTQETSQESDQVLARQKALFTSTQSINELGAISPNQIYITTLPNGAKLAFNAQTKRYYQAGLWHYQGYALFSTENTQIIDNINDLDTQLIVSNSLPIWLSLSTQQIPIYPSFLSPANLSPPFITVDIRDTKGLTLSPLYAANTGSQTQFCSEEVYFTAWGLNNGAIMNFQQMILQSSLKGAFGFGGAFIPVDEKHIQPEFYLISQKKTMKLQINYYQSSTRDIAQKLIQSAMVNYTIL
jgi:hypothetical protein